MVNTFVLLVEDNPRIQLANKDMLELLGYDVAAAMSLAQAREQIARKPPDIIVLDIMLPDGSGLSFLREMRSLPQTAFVPVILLTALGTSEDMVKGLSFGADDYLAKPYEYSVLAARIEALLRRAGRMPGTIRKDALTLDIIAACALINGENMQLTAKEFSCLLLLVQNENKPLLSETIYETVWRMPLFGDSQALRTIVTRLRGKLSGSGYTILSQRKGGYIFQKEND